MLRIMGTIIKFMVLAYMGLGFQCLVQVQRAASWWRKGLSAAGAMLLFGLPIGLVVALLPSPPHSSTPVEWIIPPAAVRGVTPAP